MIIKLPLKKAIKNKNKQIKQRRKNYYAKNDGLKENSLNNSLRRGGENRMVCIGIEATPLIC